MNEPATWPELGATNPQFVVVESEPSDGWKDPIHEVAAELNPEPLKLKTEPMVPELGKTVRLAVTLKAAYAGWSFCGEPLTVTFQYTSVVADGPTMKLPVATCELIVQVGEVIRRLLRVCLGPGNSLYASTVHEPLSVIEKPVPLKLTSAPFVALVVESTSVPLTFTVKDVNALSPCEPVTVIV
jgi:hypothetical protein